MHTTLCVSGMPSSARSSSSKSTWAVVKVLPSPRLRRASWKLTQAWYTDPRSHVAPLRVGASSIRPSMATTVEHGHVPETPPPGAAPTRCGGQPAASPAARRCLEQRLHGRREVGAVPLADRGSRRRILHEHEAPPLGVRGVGACARAPGTRGAPSGARAAQCRGACAPPAWSRAGGPRCRDRTASWRRVCPETRTGARSRAGRRAAPGFTPGRRGTHTSDARPSRWW